MYKLWKGAITMAKNFSKILLGLTAIGAAGAGAYYWYKKKNSSDVEDEFDDDFENDDFELDDDLGEVPPREYVSLTPSQESKDVSDAAAEGTDVTDDVFNTETVEEATE